MTDLKQRQLDYWTKYKEHMEIASTVKCKKASALNYINHVIGVSGVELAAHALKGGDFGFAEPAILAVLWWRGEDRQGKFAALHEEKERIERDLGFSLTWWIPPDDTIYRVWSPLASDFRDESRRPEQFEWLRKRFESMRRVFTPILRDPRFIVKSRMPVDLPAITDRAAPERW